MTFDEAKKDMTKAERHLAKIRTAREGLERALADAQARLEAAQADREAALAAGRVQDLPKHGALLENGKITVQAATDDLEAIQGAEHSALGDVVKAEKACKDSLMEAWDQEADQAKQELIEVAGPALKKFWFALYQSNYPQPLGEVLRSPAVGLKSGLEDAAQAAPDHEFGLPETIESTLLSHADRSKFTRHPQG